MVQLCVNWVLNGLLEIIVSYPFGMTNGWTWTLSGSVLRAHFRRERLISEYVIFTLMVCGSCINYASSSLPFSVNLSRPRR